MASQASSSTATPNPSLVLFARGVIAILSTWPVLRIAVSELWGGPESLQKRTWMASELVDLFEASLPKSSPSSSTPAPDADDVEDLLLQAMVDEFGCEVDDGSSPKIAMEVVDLWKVVVEGEGAVISEKVQGLEARANNANGVVVHVRRAVGDEEDDDEGDEDDDEMEVDGEEDEEAPTLQPARTTKTASEPEIDQDGFTVVKGKRRR